MIVMQDWEDQRKPYPLSWTEQRLLFEILPSHLQRIALFKVNTGTREQDVCGLRWEWEERVPALGTSVFVIPGHHVKNGEDRVVALNAGARSIIDGQRNAHPTWVFPTRGIVSLRCITRHGSGHANLRRGDMKRLLVEVPRTDFDLCVCKT